MTEISTGWHHGMLMADYLAIEAMSASGIEAFRRSPAHFKEQRENPKDETQDMKEGTGLHYALLEPSLFEGRYVALGQCEAMTGNNTRCTNQGSFYRDGKSYCGVRGHDPLMKAPMADGIEVMPAEALDRIEGMKRAVLAHPDARQFFVGKGASELVGVWRDQATGALCKLRLDRQIDRADYIHADLKATFDASRDAFRRTAGRLGYHRKAAWYRRGMAALGKPASASVLIAVEKYPPFGCATYILDEPQLDLVGKGIDALMASYAECLRTNEWPGYEAGLRHLDFAPWDMPEQKAPGFDWDDAETWVEEEVGA